MMYGTTIECLRHRTCSWDIIYSTPDCCTFK